MVLAQLRAVYNRNPSMFAPAGPYAHRIALLGWGMIIAATIIFVAVLYLMLAGLWRRRHATVASESDQPTPFASAERWVLGGGMLMPILVLAGVFLATLGTLRAEGHLDEQAALTVQVVGHQWWWEIRYPGAAFVTADEIHIPLGQPVRLTLRSADVIHSFWVPQLNGKTDLIPGQENTMFLEASTAGAYRGQCAEFCGMQHAQMAFSVVAESPRAYLAWVNRQRQSAPIPTDSVQLAGRRAFSAHSCSFCHTIRGAGASGTVGPDLTHIASRLTIAGGALQNTPATLGGWIANPDRIKPGTRMPAVPMSGGDLNAIVQYLETLK